MISALKDSLNTNADLLSCLTPESSCAVTATTLQFSDVVAAQQSDTIISTPLEAHLRSECIPQGEK